MITIYHDIYMVLKDIPVEKNSICWLGMFWSMAAGLSWFLAGHVLVLSN